MRVAVDLVGDLVEGERPLGRAPHRDDAVGGFEVLRGRLEHVRRDGQHLVADGRRGQMRRRAPDDDAPGAVVAETPRARLGVALDHTDPVERAAEGIRHDLGDAGLVAAARGRDAGEHGDLAGRAHSHLGPVGAVEEQ